MLDLQRLKSEINFVHYALSLGFEIDQRKTTRQSVALRKGHEDKIIVSKRGGLWMYFSVYDDQDHGTILDFVIHRTGQSLTEAARSLFEWLDGSAALIPQTFYTPEEPKRDTSRISRLYQHYRVATHHPYLEQRGITQETLSSELFRGRALCDQFGNAVFAHYRQGKPCAIELKGETISLFVRGSEKTLWRSNVLSDQTHLFIAESAIDALSYHQLFRPKSAFYIATAGSFSKAQSLLLKEHLDAKPYKVITLITDHNQGGFKLAQRLTEIIDRSAFDGQLKTHHPPQAGDDWNDALRRQYLF